MSRNSVGKKQPPRPSNSTKKSDSVFETRVALVYDRVNKFGGAERVLSILHQLFPKAPLYTLVSNKKKAPWANKITVKSSLFNLPLIQNRHELLTPLAPLGFESFKFNQFDIVISITSSDAKAVITPPETLHICYCLTPPRYLWEQNKIYETNPGFGIYNRVARGVFAKAQTWLKERDLILAQRPDQYLAISQTVADRILKHYGKTAPVVYPGVNTRFFTPKKKNRQYYLVVGRLVPYKRFDLVIDAFNRLGYPLVVAGSGSQLAGLKRMASSNIKFTGQISDMQLREYYRSAKALIFPQVEDFGLIPLEAAACGTPVIAYGQGGAKETVIHDQTGIHFKKQTASAIIRAVKEFEKTQINPQLCHRQAVKFNEVRFATDLAVSLNRLWIQHQKTFM